MWVSAKYSVAEESIARAPEEAGYPTRAFVAGPPSGPVPPPANRPDHARGSDFPDMTVLKNAHVPGGIESKRVRNVQLSQKSRTAVVRKSAYTRAGERRDDSVGIDPADAMRGRVGDVEISASNASPAGLMFACSAGPPSPENPHVPVPATRLRELVSNLESDVQLQRERQMEEPFTPSQGCTMAQ
jgi:hypothetical protein